jgi:hypothetical protein
MCKYCNESCPSNRSLRGNLTSEIIII